MLDSGTRRSKRKPEPKPPHEMTDAELIRHVFPKEVAEELEREAQSQSPDESESKD